MNDLILSTNLHNKSHVNEIRELSLDEIEDVNGGLLAFGAAVGAWAGGGDLGEIVAGAAMGGLSGFFGGLVE